MATDDVRPVPKPQLSLNLAVTGHRKLDPAQASALPAIINNLLDRLRDAVLEAQAASVLDQDRRLRLRLICALAAGADQLVARTVLERPDHARPSPSAWALEVIVPYREDAYYARMGQGLTAKASKTATAEFTELRARACAVYELGDWWPRTGDKANAGLDDYWVERRYRTLGQMLVRRADLLIAIWDGQPGKGPGGTADVVTEARRVGLPIVWIDIEALTRGEPEASVFGLVEDDEPLITNVVELAAIARRRDASARAKGLAGALTAAVRSVLFGSIDGATPVKPVQNPHPGPGSLDYFLAAGPMGRTERLRDRTWASFYQLFVWFILLGAKFRQFAPQKGKPLVSFPALRIQTRYVRDDEVRLAPNPQGEDSMRGLFLASDLVATRLGHIYRSTYVFIFLAAGLAVCVGLSSLFLDIYDPNPSISAHGSGFHLTKPHIVGLELGVIFALILVHRMSQKLRIHDRWLKARSIAESSRGLMFLTGIGFGGRRPTYVFPDVHAMETGDDAPRKDWAVDLLNAVLAEPDVPNLIMDQPRILQTIAALQWIVNDQILYHRRNTERLSRLHRRLDILSWLMVLGAAILGVALLVAYPYKADIHEAPTAFLILKALTTFAGGAGPAIAASLASIRYQGDFERFALRSHKTAHQLDDIRQSLADFKSGLETRSLISPPFETLLEIALATQAVFEGDLDDWRFVYAARPTPGL